MATTHATNRTTAVGVFSDRTAARQAVDDLRRAGFRDDQIGVVTHKDDEYAPTDEKSTGTKAGQGAAIGAVAGAGVGTLWALGIAAAMLPPLGVVAGGTLMAVLASAGAGAVVASIGGALIGLGIPEDEARYYEDEVKAGRTLVTVRADSRYDEAVAILRRHGGYDMATRGSATGTATRTETGRVVQLKEEQLHAHKTPVQTGEVKVRKDVVTEHKTINVPVEREEVVIERHPVSGQPTSASNIREGQEIRIPVKEEKVHVEKEAVVVEEVDVAKRKVRDTQQVAGDVRKEQLKVEREGDVNVRDAGTGRK